jgi:hypothetical protein
MGDSAEGKELEAHSESDRSGDQVVRAKSGLARVPTPAVEVFCRQCGSRREDVDRYCTGCGALLPQVRATASVRRPGVQTPAPRPPTVTIAYGQSVNTPAVIATVSGVVSLVALPLGVGWLWFFGAVAALVFGFVARSQINSNDQAGRGYMIAGITMGFLSLGIAVLVLLTGIVALSILAR